VQPGVPLPVDIPDAAARQVFVQILGDDEALFDRCRAEAHADEPGPYGLTWFERLAIWIYSSTDERWYERVNQELREGHATPGIQEFARMLDSALEKLPVHRGEVYRGMTVPDIDAIMEDYEVGHTTQWTAFTSTTKNAERAFEGNVLFIIASLNGRELGPYSDKLSEEEVLFQTGLRIEVLGLEQQGGLLVINVAELSQ